MCTFVPAAEAKCLISVGDLTLVAFQWFILVGRKSDCNLQSGNSNFTLAIKSLSIAKANLHLNVCVVSIFYFLARKGYYLLFFFLGVTIASALCACQC